MMPRLSVEERSEIAQENAADAWPRDSLRYKKLLQLFAELTSNTPWATRYRV